jgi:two-component sensor histidine kinase
VLTRSFELNGAAVTFTKVMRDITDRKEQDDQLRRSLEEKSMLVREIHHRVKNNLQMIVSLLSLQSSHTEDPHVIAAFEETEGRVRAIGHIHEQLYASDDLTTVEVGGYLAALARELIALNGGAAGGIQLHVNVQEILLHIEKAVPLGLIANELIVNSLKHGLRSGTGHLSLTLKYIEEDGGAPWAELLIEDTGPGLPSELDLSSAESMGYQLVNLLVRQLRARLEFESRPGARIRISFPIPSK